MLHNSLIECFSDCLYISTGEYDNWQDVENSYYVFKNDTARFSDDNLYYSRFSQTAHEYREWLNALYNSMQLFFR